LAHTWWHVRVPSLKELLKLSGLFPLIAEWTILVPHEITADSNNYRRFVVFNLVADFFFLQYGKKKQLQLSK
jgi:hypothetical protein